ncbi:Ig-like domain-containing protein, partial [Yoonia sp. 208BN28-4]|uniref:Ig-like domain-containing protein n=1 Tax=Yoonia sp. 208BN28-4 TaxID=3126505 RepID=UPI0030A075FD
VTYTIVDDNGLTDTTTVTVTVTGTNDGPVAVADTGTTDEDTPVVLDNVLGNDTDPDGDTLTVAEVDGDPANVGTPTDGSDGGSFTINPDGTASFDPDGDFEELAPGEEATTSITYTVTDPDGAESTTTVTVTVTGVNDAPNAVDSSYTVGQDEAAGDEDANAITDDTGEGVDSDPEDDPLTVVAVDGDAANVGNVVAGDNGGLFTINADGTVDFDANGEFDDLGEGEDATTTVSYTIADPDGLESTANVTFTVTGTNDGPVAVADPFEVNEDDAPADLGNVLDNDTDPDGDPLTVSEVNGDPANVGQPVDGSDGGLVTINPDGTISFDPNGDFEDLDEDEEATTTVTYTVTDPDGSESTTTVTITVTGTNDAPVAVMDEDTTDQDTAIVLDNVLGNDEDPEDDPLTVSEVDGDPANVGQPVD